MKFIPNAVSSKFARAALKTQETSPKTLFVVGLVGVGATVVLACRATLKVEDILDTIEGDLDTIENVKNDPTRVETYTDADARKDKAIVYVRGTRDLVRIYAPAVVVATISVGALVGSHNVLSRRNAALTAAYGGLQKAFDGYRERVRSEVGEKKEQEIYHDVQPCEIEDDKGKKTTKKLANGGGPYSFLWDEHNVNWEPVPEANFLFLKLQQGYANQRLQARGHLFLNEVLESIGLPHTPAGAVTGWKAGAEGKDDYVDFGIFVKGREERLLDFMVGREKAIWLDFNVDGTIYKTI